MYTRKTGTIAFQIEDNESSGKRNSSVPFAQSNRSFGPTLANNTEKLDTGAHLILVPVRNLTADYTKTTMLIGSRVPLRLQQTISLNLITHWEQKRIHSYKGSNGRRRTKLELLNKLLTWKQTQHVQRPKNATSDERERQTRTEERKL